MLARRYAANSPGLFEVAAVDGAASFRVVLKPPGVQMSADGSVVLVLVLVLLR